MKLKVLEGLFPTMEADLHDGILDFYVGPMTHAAQPVELLIDVLFENERIVVSRQGHPLGFAKSLAELNDASWVVSTLNHEASLELNPTFEALNLPRPHIAVLTETALSMMSLVSSSDLLAMLPQQWLEFMAQTGLLQQVPVEERLAAPPICMVRRARLPLTPAAEYLSDLFRRAAVDHARRLAAQAPEAA